MKSCNGKTALSCPATLVALALSSSVAACSDPVVTYLAQAPDSGIADAGQKTESGVPTDSGPSRISDAKDDKPDLDASKGGSDADAADAIDEDSPTDATGDESDAPPDGPTGPNVCGDGWRDPVVEECDDGLDPSVPIGDRACTADCRVVDRIVGEPAANASDRWLGNGVHPVAGGVHGHAVVVTEVVGPSSDDVHVALYAFSPVGQRLGATSWGPVPFEADPVVAALPNGDYAVAHTAFDADGDGLGIALVRVSNDGVIATPMGAANTTKVFAQRSPDMMWTGKHLVVGWEDESTVPRRVCTRQFTEELTPAGGESCVWSTQSLSRVSISPLHGETATSLRMDGDEETVFAVMLPGGEVFKTEPVLSPPFDESVTIAPLDDGAQLAVYVDGERVMRAVVFDAGGNALRAPVVLGGGRGRPTLARTPSGLYLSWWEVAEEPEGAIGWDPVFEELWLQRVGWVGPDLDLTSQPIPLPRGDAPRLGDQVMVSMVPVPYWPTGALAAVWTDLRGGNFGGQAPHAEVVIELIPTPIVRTVGGI